MLTTTRQRILEIIKANEPLAVCAKIADEIDERDAEIAALKLKVKWFSLSPLSEEDVVALKAIADSEGGRVRGV